MKTGELKQKYIEFFIENGHAEISGSSLIPENDPTVLFTTAGMHPLVPYILGEPHPAGKRLVDVQKCIRTGDIEEVGDPSHLTFFEMLGNWSLGDYFKEEAIRLSYEFLTSPRWLGFDPQSLSVTVFAAILQRSAMQYVQLLVVVATVPAIWGRIVRTVLEIVIVMMVMNVQ